MGGTVLDGGLADLTCAASLDQLGAIACNVLRPDRLEWLAAKEGLEITDRGKVCVECLGIEPPRIDLVVPEAALVLRRPCQACLPSFLPIPPLRPPSSSPAPSDGRWQG